MKRALRRVLGPVLRPVWHRIRPRVARITDLFKLSDAWHQVLPTLTNAAASVGAVSREQARMKKEYDAAIAELRAAIAQLQAGDAAPAEGSGLKLNLGPVPRTGYTNVHTTQAPGIDVVVAGFDALPFAPGEVSEIRVQQVDASLVPYWMGLLKAGGTLRAVK
jgi:hypothetical protein